MKNDNGRIIIISLLIACASGYAVAEDADLRSVARRRIEGRHFESAAGLPPIAKQLHLEGAVEVEVHITEEGAVDSVKALTGNAVLANAAVAATKHWKFTPFTAAGKPVKATAELTFNFKL